MSTKETISIFIQPIDDDGCSRMRILEIAKLFPEFSRIGKCGIEIALLRANGEDERVASLITQARQVGYNIFEEESSASGLSIVLKRTYGERECSACSYLDYCYADGVYLGEVDYPLSCDPKGVPALAGKPRQKARLFGSPEPVHPSFFVVRGEAKEKLKNAGFKGLRLYPVVFNRARSLAPEDQLWAVWSDLVLPPMKNLFRNDTGEMGFAENMPDTSVGISPVCGFLSPAELHYRREDLERFGGFDVAMIREPLKVHGTLSPRPVFSQRFRRFVIEELGVPFKGIPVRIDDDDIIPWEGPYPSKWAHLNRRPEWLEKLQEEASRRGAK